MFLLVLFNQLQHCSGQQEQGDSDNAYHCGNTPDKTVHRIIYLYNNIHIPFPLFSFFFVTIVTFFLIISQFFVHNKQIYFFDSKDIFFTDIE